MPRPVRVQELLPACLFSGITVITEEDRQVSKGPMHGGNKCYTRYSQNEIVLAGRLGYYNRLLLMNLPANAREGKNCNDVCLEYEGLRELLKVPSGPHAICNVRDLTS